MKRLLLFILIFVSFWANSQDLEGNRIVLKDSMMTYKNSTWATIIAPQDDGLSKIKNVSDPVDGKDAVNLDYINSLPIVGWDTLTWDSLTGNVSWYVAGVLTGFVNIDGRYAIGDLSNYVAISDSGVVYLTPEQTMDSIFRYTRQDIYTISLPSANSVGDRISGAVEGTDYPLGWVLSEGASSVDIDIQHDLGRRVHSVTIVAVDGTQEQQLFNTAAYNGIITPDEDNLRIQSLATIKKPIVISILFR